MTTWNAGQYLKFGSERTRAAADLAARIRLDAPQRIVDLGCGPGNSTRLLRARWPDADVVGVDHSDDMLQVAREEFPQQKWVQADLSKWHPEQPVDLVYSNAAIHWIPDHRALLQHLLTLLAPGGVLAFQIPSSTYATVRTLAHEISHDPRWNDRLQSARGALTMEPPEFYYDALAGAADHLDIWETEYQHVMESADSVVDWIASTGLRPFLAALRDDAERLLFLGQLRQQVQRAYPKRVDGKVLHPFRRTFVIAYC